MKSKFERGKEYRIKGIKYCRHCMGVNVPLIKECVSSNGGIFYSCRDCTRLRMEKYMSTKEGRETVYRNVYKSIKNPKNKGHQSARASVRYAIKIGKIIRPKFCSKCESQGTIEAHHSDYTKPLKIVWVCKKCHCLLDKKLEKKNEKRNRIKIR